MIILTRNAIRNAIQSIVTDLSSEIKSFIVDMFVTDVSSFYLNFCGVTYYVGVISSKKKKKSNRLLQSEFFFSWNTLLELSLVAVPAHENLSHYGWILVSAHK